MSFIKVEPILTRRRLVIVVLLVISIAVVILLMRLPAVLERVAVSKLEGLGATEISLTVVDIGLGATQLGELSFVLERQAWRYTITSHDNGLYYIQSEQIRRELETVNVPNITNLDEELQSSEVSGKSSILPPADWLANIPFKDFNLEHLKL